MRSGSDKLGIVSGYYSMKAKGQVCNAFVPFDISKLSNGKLIINYD